MLQNEEHFVENRSRWLSIGKTLVQSFESCWVSCFFHTTPFLPEKASERGTIHIDKYLWTFLQKGTKSQPIPTRKTVDFLNQRYNLIFQVRIRILEDLYLPYEIDSFSVLKGVSDNICGILNNGNFWYNELNQHLEVVCNSANQYFLIEKFMLVQILAGVKDLFNGF